MYYVLALIAYVVSSILIGNSGNFIVDSIWPLFLLLGMERVIVVPGATAVTPLDFISYPLSHSLLADLGWACLFAGIYKIVKGDSKGAICLWFVLISHWLLDALSHQPDLPLYPGGSNVCRPGPLEFARGDDPCGKRHLRIRGDALCKGHSSPRPHRTPCLPLVHRLAVSALPHQHFRPSATQRKGRGHRESRHVAVRCLGLLAGPPPARGSITSSRRPGNPAAPRGAAASTVSRLVGHMPRKEDANSDVLRNRQLGGR